MMASKRTASNPGMTSADRKAIEEEVFLQWSISLQHTLFTSWNLAKRWLKAQCICSLFVPQDLNLSKTADSDTQALATTFNGLVTSFTSQPPWKRFKEYAQLFSWQTWFAGLYGTQASQAFQPLPQRKRAAPTADIIGCIVASNFMTGQIVGFRFSHKEPDITMTSCLLTDGYAQIPFPDFLFKIWPKTWMTHGMQTGAGPSSVITETAWSITGSTSSSGQIIVQKVTASCHRLQAEEGAAIRIELCWN